MQNKQNVQEKTRGSINMTQYMPSKHLAPPHGFLKKRKEKKC